MIFRKHEKDLLKRNSSMIKGDTLNKLMLIKEVFPEAELYSIRQETVVSEGLTEFGKGALDDIRRMLALK